jgi:hypothetical protein
MARNLAQGQRQDSVLRANPEIAAAWRDYDSCRVLAVHSQQYSKGKDNMIRTLTFPTGYSILPNAGGLLDQPHYLMELFDAFMDGERFAFAHPKGS